MTQGWECPRCGGCYAPFVQGCPRCQPRSTVAAGSVAAFPTPWGVPCIHDWIGEDTEGSYCRKCGERNQCPLTT